MESIFEIHLIQCGIDYGIIDVVKATSPLTALKGIRKPRWPKELEARPENLKDEIEMTHGQIDRMEKELNQLKSYLTKLNIWRGNVL